MVGICAAHKQAGLRTLATCAGHLNAGRASQQVKQALGLRGFNIFQCKHGGCCHGFTQRLSQAVGGDDDFLGLDICA